MEIDERGRLEREAGTSIGGLLRGCLTEKIAGKNRRTLSHEHTIFRDAIFPDACARTWWQIGGGKKTPPISRRAHDFSRYDFSRCLRADVVGNRRGQKNTTHFQTEFSVATVSHRKNR